MQRTSVLAGKDMKLVASKSEKLDGFIRFIFPMNSLNITYLLHRTTMYIAPHEPPR